MELYLINPIAEPIVSAQRRRIFIRLETPTDGLFGARELAKLRQLRLRPAGALALQRCTEDCIGLKEIVIDERRGLVRSMHGIKDTKNYGRE